jgi:hypothetical protein
MSRAMLEVLVRSRRIRLDREYIQIYLSSMELGIEEGVVER